MCLDGRSFGNCSTYRDGGQMIHLVEVCLGRARCRRKLCKLFIHGTSSKTVFKDSAKILSALSTDCFAESIYCITLQNMHISQYAFFTLKLLNDWDKYENHIFPINKF